MYEIRRHGDAYKIYEKNTKQYIVKTKFKKKASDILSNLKNGGGFEGTTPRFMIQAGELDIDKKIKKIPQLKIIVVGGSPCGKENNEPRKNQIRTTNEPKSRFNLLSP